MPCFLTTDPTALLEGVRPPVELPRLRRCDLVVKKRCIRENVNQMLEEHFPYPQSDFAKEHYGKGVADGRSEGRRERRRQGRSEGRREGEATLLLRQLTHRFGELPAGVEARIRSADDANLQRWGVRLLDANTLDAVFADD